MFNNQNATDMTKQEFIQRAIVKVSDDEFNAINTVYMASDVDKDTFCAMWRKMNSSRVKQAKAAAKRVGELRKMIDKLLNVVNMIERLTWEERNIQFMSNFTNNAIDSLLETNGIDIFFKQPASVRAEIMARIDAYNNEIKEIA